mmetsp:Transcript_14397/g.33838  ORF Transcript_14397/g.33838 Transcript_14397/m.33838 type:complete len:123 (-) Transcript_14397:485-853(-)
MATVERGARTSPATQAWFREGCGLDGWMDHAAVLQERIVDTFGFDPAVVTPLLRTAHLEHPDVPALRTIPIQVRYNRTCAGILEGGPLVDVPLVRHDNADTTTLAREIRGPAPCVVVAGSLT